MCVSAGGNVTPRLLPDQMIYTDPKNEKETPCDIPNPAGIIGLLLSGGFQWDIDCLRYLPSDAPYLLVLHIRCPSRLLQIQGLESPAAQLSSVQKRAGFKYAWMMLKLSNHSAD